MDRRGLIIALAGGPFAVRAQPVGRRFRIGYLSLGTPATEATRFVAFQQGLAALGYVEGGTIDIATRWLGGRKYELLEELAGELVALNVDVVVTYSSRGVQAAKHATQTIPIVFFSVGDAVALGLVGSLARPGGNVTGTSYFLPELAAKRVELLMEAMPAVRTMGVLFNPANASTELAVAATRAAARRWKVEVVEAPAPKPEELEGAVAAMAGRGVAAFIVNEDPTLIYSAAAIAGLAQKYGLGSCGFPELAEAGGLLAYGIDLAEAWRRGALFLDKIFKGAKPADIPVEQATKFRLEINLGAARALGLSLPLALTARADELIE